ncbi:MULTISPECIES: D-lyxose/D-mannose family sugar isomerase [unclassified Fusibacter]|uniref:D-lyxose/D-mannose family sugar isomerase n=1 Tax=unclassified Fusibacter TaxID=2624464 RepID=UPI0013E9495E|nr:MULTISPECIES: D-lyxose/D-mannose family sugar isomerase [unclassified Fusibacter]MCK8058627.1 D-lyxose/D-mannose family sugar isomerase [Fusibacter sp. A2]NPE21702.1 D-lyxose/D-mannose family sugar isomerase [Fusibacter sp. A1]
MKRSDINNALQWSRNLLETYQIKLPPFGYWTMEKWNEKDPDVIKSIRDVMLGWDITDFGQDDFKRLGAVLFTLRNGSVSDRSLGTPYAEKLIVLSDGQRLPLHCHKSKTEDIINRAGGVLAIKIYNSTPDGDVDHSSDVEVYLDGEKHLVKAGEELNLNPGESITLKPHMYHLFWAKEGCGDLICGEVSSINDDRTDNYNAEPVSRFTKVVEDEAILHPLCNEYEHVLKERN